MIFLINKGYGFVYHPLLSEKHVLGVKPSDQHLVVCLLLSSVLFIIFSFLLLIIKKESIKEEKENKYDSYNSFSKEELEKKNKERERIEKENKSNQLESNSEEYTTEIIQAEVGVIKRKK